MHIKKKNSLQIYPLFIIHRWQKKKIKLCNVVSYICAEETGHFMGAATAHRKREQFYHCRRRCSFQTNLNESATNVFLRSYIIEFGI